jgi:hypothetical protein
MAPLTLLYSSWTGFFMSTVASGTFANGPEYFAVAPNGTVYFTGDTGYIQMITQNNTIVNIAGNGTTGFSDGPANQAMFNNPRGIVYRPDGYIFVADSYNGRIRMIYPNLTVTTIAGDGSSYAVVNGPNGTSKLNFPEGLALHPNGAMMVM